MLEVINLAATNYTLQKESTYFYNGLTTLYASRHYYYTYYLSIAIIAEKTRLKRLSVPM